MSRPRSQRCYLLLERLEDRTNPGVILSPSANVNISAAQDNQAEPAIAVDPTNAQNQFAASMTYHGAQYGVFAPQIRTFQVGALLINGEVPTGLFVNSSQTAGRTWPAGRFLATGGPVPPTASAADQSLPAAIADPQATYDRYGNLYLTYLSGQVQQWGALTATAATTVSDTTRRWVPHEWQNQVLGVVVGQNQPIQWIPISDNTADTLTLGGMGRNWGGWVNGVRPVPGANYVIVSSAYVPGVPLPNAVAASSVVVDYSPDNGQNFYFLRRFDTGPANSVDYPAIATGPGQNGNNGSVWVAWKASSNTIKADGASVTGSFPFRRLPLPRCRPPLPVLARFKTSRFPGLPTSCCLASPSGPMARWPSVPIRCSGMETARSPPTFS